jgi:hypothetical protein
MHGASLLLQIPDVSDSDTETSVSTPVRSRRTESNVDSDLEVDLGSATRDWLLSPKQSSPKKGSDASDTNVVSSARQRSRTQSSIKKSHQRMLLHKQARHTPQKFIEVPSADL